MKSATLAMWIVLVAAPAGALAQDSFESSLFAGGCAGITGPDRVDCLRQEQGFSGSPFGGSTFGGSASGLDRLGIPAIGSGGLSGLPGTANTFPLPPSSSVGTTPLDTSPSTSPSPLSTPPTDSQVTVGGSGADDMGVSEFDEDPLLDPFN